MRETTGQSANFRPNYAWLSNPARTAFAAAADLELTLKTRRSADTWMLTVYGEISNFRPISLLVFPSAIKRRTSRCRAVRKEKSVRRLLADDITDDDRLMTNSPSSILRIAALTSSGITALLMKPFAPMPTIRSIVAVSSSIDRMIIEECLNSCRNSTIDLAGSRPGKTQSRMNVFGAGPVRAKASISSKVPASCTSANG